MYIAVTLSMNLMFKMTHNLTICCINGFNVTFEHPKHAYALY